MNGAAGDDGDLFVARAGLILALRGIGISDRQLLEAFESVPHERFVPEEYAEYAYKDASLPIGSGQSITSPMTLARLMSVLDAAGAPKILEIGSGSGYSAMLLSRLGRRVFSLERDRTLLASASARWLALNAGHIVGFAADGLAPFDRILLTGSVDEIPDALRHQIADGGILVAAVGPAAERQTITSVTREGDREIIAEHGTVRLPPLSSSLP
jgi:protein-L-isoaspartate(D-aspartate) O-methyltransferase